MSTLFGQTHEQLTEQKAIHTAKEIHHQPKLWQQLYAALAQLSPQIDAFLQPVINQTDCQIILTGAGSSAFAGRAIVPWLKAHTGKDVLAIATTDIVANPKHYLTPNKPTLLVSFGRSGNSPESVAAVELADQVCTNIHHLMLVCNPKGALATYANDRDNALALIMPEGSNDQSFAMTSSFSCMLLAATLLLGNFKFDQQTEESINLLAHSVEQLGERFIQPIKQLAQSGFKRYVVIGSCGFAGLAEESALKMLELTAGSVATRHDSALGLRHGPKFMVDRDTLVLQFIANDTYTQQYDIDLLAELKRDGIAMKHVVLTGSDQAQQAVGHYDHTYQLIQSDNDVWPIFAYLYFAQLVAMETSLAYKNTPDNPCPTGEVNRVVQGVKIHAYES